MDADEHDPGQASTVPHVYASFLSTFHMPYSDLARSVCREPGCSHLTFDSEKARQDHQRKVHQLQVKHIKFAPPENPADPHPVYTLTRQAGTPWTCARCNHEIGNTKKVAAHHKGCSHPQSQLPDTYILTNTNCRVTAVQVCTLSFSS